MGGPPKGDSLTATESVMSMTTVGSTASKRARKSNRSKIEDILTSPATDSGTASGPDLIRKLEEKVRKKLDYKRIEFDRFHLEVKKNKDVLTSLKLELRDLKCDGAAIGLDKFPEPGIRLKPIASVSRRPIFTPDGNIENMVKMVSEKLQQAEGVKHVTQQYEYMKKRLEKERVEEILKQSKLQDESRELRLQTLELQRAVTQATEALHKETRSLKQQQVKFKEEQSLWEKEISGRKKCKREKDRFENFCNLNIERQREIELEATGDLTSEQEKELRAKRAVVEMYKVQKTKEHTTTMLEAEHEESIYKDAFLSIGARASAFNPNAIIKSCLVQDDVKKDLEIKKKKHENGILALKEKLAMLKRSHQDKEFSLSPAKSLSKSFAEKEKILNQKIKANDHERKQFQFINKDIHPVQVGLRLIFKKVLGVAGDTTNLEEIKRLAGQAEAKLVEIGKSNARIENDLSSVEKQKLVSLAATSALMTNNNTNNVRVQSSQAQEMFDMDDVRKFRKNTKSGESFHSVEEGNRGNANDQSRLLPDRSSVKGDSCRILQANMSRDSKRISPKKGGRNKKRMVVNKC